MAWFHYRAYLGATFRIFQFGKQEGKKGSRVHVYFGPEQKKAFQDLKEALLQGLELQTVQPDTSFILRFDASEKAVGATLD